MTDRTYDPDEHERAVKEITPEAFGRAVAGVVLGEPRSHYWALVHRAIEAETGWQIEHEDLEPFLRRIASGSGVTNDHDHEE